MFSSCLGNLRLQRKQRFSGTDMLEGICSSETGIIFDGRADGRTHGQMLGIRYTSTLRLGGL